MERIVPEVAMRGFCTVVMAVAASLGPSATGWADESVPTADSRPADSAAVAEPAGDARTSEADAVAPSVSADGTTSVVVPAVEPAAPLGPLPAERAAPPAQPSTMPASPYGAVAAPPAAAPQTAASGSPAGLQQAPPPPPAASSSAATLLASLLEPVAGPPGAAAYARPLPLLEALVRSGDRSRRLWIVQAYWKVATAYAGVRCAAAAVERLELVAPGGDPHDRATLDVATAAARADLADASARLGVAQQELVDLARLPFGEPAPWPIDRPLADPYQTRFEEIFATRIATGRVRAIVRTLPARHEALAARAVAVTAADHAMLQAEADHAKANRPIEAVIAAHTAVIDQQAAFLDAVRSYNLEIAEYAMAVADLSLPDDQFVSMLIASPVTWQPPPVESAAPAPPGGLAPVAVPAPPASIPAASIIQVE